MKIKAKFLMLIFSAVIIGCENNTEEVGIDCSASDLLIEVISSVKSDCDEPGSITVNATGGEGEYSFSSDGESFQTTTILNNLFAGNFNLTVRDRVGCTASTNFTLESEPTGVTLSLESTNSDCINNTGSVTALATGGVGTLQYSIDQSPFSTSNSFQSVGAGPHTVTVRDNEGCEVTKTVLVETGTSLVNDIMPIIQADCAISGGCHNGSQRPDLRTKEAVLQNARDIKAETQAGSMPKNRTLSEAEIALIACWVDDGAKDN